MAPPHTSTASSAPRPRRRFRINRKVGAGAGLIALAVVLGALSGALWGLWRPAYTAVADDGGVYLETAGDVEFASYITFAVLTGIVGIILSLTSYLRAPEARGLGMLLWVGVSAVIASVAFLLLGEAVARVVHDSASLHAAQAGETVQIVPPLDPGIAFVAAPLTATLSYWLAALIEPEPAAGD